MEILIQEPKSGEDDRVIIRVERMTQRILRAIDILKQPDDLTVYHDGQVVLIPVSDVFYIESVDSKTFVNTKSDVYSMKLKLYEVEELLGGDFFRMSKSTIVNLKKVTGISPAGAGRFQANLVNGEKVIISRQYVPKLKERFGL